MRRFMAVMAAGVFAAGVLQAQAALEGRAQAVVDPNSKDQSAIGGLVGLGVPVSERLTVGGFGYMVNTDRDLPQKMSRINALGAFAEYDLSEGYDLMPFVGARLGLLGGSGPSYDTAAHAAGTVGIKYRFTERLTAAVSANYLWASEYYFDYERKDHVMPTDPFYEAHNTCFTLDFGIRWMF